MTKKVPKPPAGAPGWVVTYGDLMSLLMCFFVLLFSISSLEADKAAAVIDSMNEGFGFPSDGRASNIDVVRQRIDKLNRGRFRGEGPEKAPRIVPQVHEIQEGEELPKGEEPTIQAVPQFRLKQDTGFLIQFKYGEDTLGVKAKMDLKKVQLALTGSPYKVLIKGHTTDGEHGAYKQGIDLAYTRAVNVRDYLVSLGMPNKQFQILVLGEYEPIRRDQLPKGTNPKEADSVVVIMMSAANLDH